MGSAELRLLLFEFMTTVYWPRVLFGWQRARQFTGLYWVTPLTVVKRGWLRPPQV
jgi:hypothetical protein